MVCHMQSMACNLLIIGLAHNPRRWQLLVLTAITTGKSLVQVKERRWPVWTSWWRCNSAGLLNFALHSGHGYSNFSVFAAWFVDLRTAQRARPAKWNKSQNPDKRPHLRMEHPPKKLPLPLAGSRPQPTAVSWTHSSPHPKCTSIGPDIFVGLMVVSNKQTHRHTLYL